MAHSYHGGPIFFLLGEFPPFALLYFHQLDMHFHNWEPPKKHNLITLIPSPCHEISYPFSLFKGSKTRRKKVGYLTPRALVFLVDRHNFFYFLISFLFFFHIINTSYAIKLHSRVATIRCLILCHGMTKLNITLLKIW